MSEFLRSLVDDRRHAAGQGYERIYTVRISELVAGVSRPGTVPHTVRVTAHRGNSMDYTHVDADRWDGSQWHRILRLRDTDVLVDFDKVRPGHFEGEPPHYGCWNHEDRETNGREDCDFWLYTVTERALDQAAAVIL